MTKTPPAVRPARPYFSSGPCAKPPGWTPDKIDTRMLGRSHRSALGKERLGLCIDLMREMLQLPDTHRIGIVPGSDTGARFCFTLPVAENPPIDDAQPVAATPTEGTNP